MPELPNQSPAIVAFRVALALQFSLGVIGTLQARGMQMRPEPSLSPALSIALDAVLWALDFGVLAGLWFFRRWARPFYLALLVLPLVAIVFRPRPIVGTTSSFLLVTLESFLEGVVIAMAFLPPIAALFAQRKT